MKWLSLFTLYFHLTAGAPPQTPTQKQVLARAREKAQSASKAAESRVLELFSDPATWHYLEILDDGSGLFKMQPTELIERFWQELSIAEIVHNFGDRNMTTANCGFDMQVAFGLHAPLFYNQWQLQVLKYVPIDKGNNQFMDASETMLFGFPPFKNNSQPDWNTSSDRPIYMSMNMYRGSGGNPQCGPIGAVFDRTYLGDENFLVSPLDTGLYCGSCDHNESVARLGNFTFNKCSSWDRTPGNPPYLAHMLDPFLTFYNLTSEDAGEDWRSLNLARLLLRLISRKTYQTNNPLTLNFVENCFGGYFESDVAVQIELPIGVKMMLGMFELLWGTDEGNALRDWCIQNDWPLAWAYNPLMSNWRCGMSGDYPSCIYPHSMAVGIESANVRLLDPFVLSRVSAGYNMSVSQEAIQHFEELWQGLNVTASSSQEVENGWTNASTLFASLTVEPLFSGACANSRCVGVTVQSQECVCSGKLQ